MVVPVANRDIWLTVVFAAVLLVSVGITNTEVYAEKPSSNKIIFQDDYSSSTGWTQVGNLVTVNSPSFPGVAYFNNVFGGGGVTQDRVFKQIPTTLPGTWNADFDYKFTQSSIPAFLVFDLTTTSDDPQVLSNANRLLIEHGDGLNQLFITGSGSAIDSAGIPISPNIQYYVRLAKTPTLLTLNVFLDPARTIQAPGSPVSTNIAATDFGNLNFIQHDACTNCGPARTLTAQIDNTVIFAPSTKEDKENDEKQKQCNLGNDDSDKECKNENKLPTVPLAAEWKFENNALDTSGNGNDGVLGGGVSFVPGKIGQGLSFDGTGIDRVPVSSTLNFGSTGSFSISAWVKTTATNYWIVEHRPNNDGLYAGYSLEGIGVTGDVGGRVRDSSGHDVLVTTTNPINDNQFHDIVFVVDRSTQTSKIYLDGNLQASASIGTVGNIDQNSIGVDMGYTGFPNTPNGPFVGILDQVRIYNGALSPSDVEKLFSE